MFEDVEDRQERAQQGASMESRAERGPANDRWVWPWKDPRDRERVQSAASTAPGEEGNDDKKIPPSRRRWSQPFQDRISGFDNHRSEAPPLVAAKQC